MTAVASAARATEAVRICIPTPSSVRGVLGRPYPRCLAPGEGRIPVGQEVRIGVAAEVPAEARHHELEQLARDPLREEDGEEGRDRQDAGQPVEDSGDDQV